MKLAARSIVIWLVLIVAEIVHGILRLILLVPLVGEFRSKQIGVFTGSLIILAITYAFVKWLGASRASDLLLVGLIWVGLTFSFEILFGKFEMDLSWERLFAEYNLLAGGLMSVGIGSARLVAADYRKGAGNCLTAWLCENAYGERRASAR